MEFLLNRLKDTPIAMMVAAIVAVVLAGVVAFLTGVIALSSTAPYITQQPQVTVIWEVLSVGVLLVTFLVLLLLLFTFRDSYREERKQLVGTWNMVLQTWAWNHVSGPEASWNDTPIRYPVVFSIDQKTKALIVKFDQHNSKIFKPHTFFASVGGVTGTNVTNEYRLIFIAEATQKMQDGIKPPFGLDRNNIPMPILFDLKGSPQDGELNGSWYDLDNVINRIIYRNGNEADKERIMDHFTTIHGNFRSSVTMTKGPNTAKTATPSE
jgi:hypothetical protein